MVENIRDENLSADGADYTDYANRTTFYPFFAPFAVFARNKAFKSRHGNTISAFFLSISVVSVYSQFREKPPRPRAVLYVLLPENIDHQFFLVMYDIMPHRMQENSPGDENVAVEVGNASPKSNTDRNAA
jgi:hypothetical protein